MSHTPGPWLTSSDGVYALDDTDRVNRFSAQIDGGYVVYSRHSHVPRVRTSIEELKANVSLIAAAPDLLEALEAIANCPEHARCDWYEMVEWMCSTARAAIAKARGL